jgi:6-phosphogluconate dehydrogenase
MVHNGIEYGDMQMICEVYQIMKEASSACPTPRCRRGVSELEQDRARQLPHRDHGATSWPRWTTKRAAEVVDVILDTAGQKGTGKWTVHQPPGSARRSDPDRRGGVRPLPLRLKDERVAAAAKVLTGPAAAPIERQQGGLLEEPAQALYASKICSYAQGYQLMRAAKEYGWASELRRHRAHVARRLHHPLPFLGRDQEGLRRGPGLVNLLLDPFFTKAP